MLAKRRRTAQRKTALPVDLSRRPDLKDLYVKPHSSETYDELSRRDDVSVRSHQEPTGGERGATRRRSALARGRPERHPGPYDSWVGRGEGSVVEGAFQA